MGGGGGGKGGGSTVQQVQIPPEVLARYNAVNARAEQVAATPFQPYTGEFVAPLNQTQQAGINATSNASQMAQPYYGGATQAALAGGAGVYPGRLETGRYMNPYTQSVVGATQAAMGQQFGQQQAQQQAEAIRAGAFGGDRAGLQRQALRGQQALAEAQVIAPLYKQGYEQAQNVATQQQGVDLGAAQANRAALQNLSTQLAGLGTGAQQAALQGAQAQIAAGTLPQQTQQALDTALYQQFLQERGYPFQTTQFLGNLAMGTGALSGNTTTQTQGGGFFSSDKDDKTNIKHLGKGLYAYDYKDDVEHARKSGQPMPPKRVGPMAQDIEKQAPGLVFDVNGHKIVSDDNSMGGAVRAAGAFARGGYARGGVDPDFGSLVAAQQAIYEGLPFTGKKAGASPGLNIPSEARKVTPLNPPPMLQRKQEQDPLTTAANLGKNVVGLKEAGQKMKGWFDKSPTGAKVPDSQGAQSKGPAGVQTTTTRTADAGGMGTENPMGGGGDDMPQTAAQPPLQAVRQDYAAYDAPQGTQDLASASEDVMGGMGGGGFDAVADLGSFADFGSNAMEMADYAPEMTDFGDFGSWFAKRGGRIGPFAYGGVVPRQKAATGKFVTPGYDPEANPADIMDTVVEEGEQSPQQLLSQQKGINPPMKGGGGGDGGVDPLNAALTVGKMALMFAKDGGRIGYAEGGRGDRDPMTMLDADRLEALLSSGQKAPSQAPIKYRMDDGTELRGSTMLSGPYSEYGVGLGTGLGGGRFDIDAARGSVPGGPAQYRGMARWSKPFAYGGLVPREHHDGTDGNVVGEGRLVPADLESILNEPDTIDPRFQNKFLVEPREMQDFPEEQQRLLRSIGAPESGGQYNIRYGGLGSKGKTFDIEGGHPNIPEPTKSGKRSTAAGYFQFTKPTWDEMTGGAEMTPGYQNAAAWKLANQEYRQRTGGDLATDLKEKGVTPDILGSLSGRWEALKKYANGAPMEAAREEKAPGLTLGRSGPGKFNGVSSRSAGLGDVFSEFMPESVPTSENFWIPAASFLGGMLSSPNPKFLGALGSGLVAGASSQMELDKLNEDRAKNTMAFVKDNFKVTTDEDGKPMILDRFGTAYASTLDAQAAVAKLFLAQNLNPEIYGIPKQAVELAKKGTKSGSATIPPPPPSSGVPVGTLPANDQAQPKLPAGAAPVVEKTQEELLNMGEKELSQYVQSTPELKQKYGLINNDDPAVLDAKQRRSENAALSAKRSADTDGERFHKTQADMYRQQKDDVLKRAYGSLLEQAKMHQQSMGKAVSDYRTQLEQRNSGAVKEESELINLAELMARTETGSPQILLNELRQWGAAAGLSTDMANVTNAAEAQKIAMRRVYDIMRTQNLTRAPAAAQRGIEQIVAGPSMPGAATKPLIARALAEMEYAKERDKEYRAKHYGKDPLKFEMEYDEKHGKDFEKKVARYLTILPDPKDTNEEQKKNWMEVWGQHGYDPTKGVRGAPQPATSGNATNNVPFKVLN